MPDEWEFYFANVNDVLASLFVNLGIRNSVPDPKRPHLTWLWIHMNHQRPDGLSSSDEATVLGIIEDDVVGSLSDCATFVGRITTAGRREFYFYTDDPTQCENAIGRTMGEHPAYRFDLDHQRDEPWSQYLSLLYPSPEDFERIKNRRTLDVLADQGDQHTKTRPISHWAYFPTAEARDAFCASATTKGFTLVDNSIYVDDLSSDPFGAHLEKVSAVSDIDDVTIELLRLANSHGGDYDGWEARVEKEP